MLRFAGTVTCVLAFGVACVSSHPSNEDGGLDLALITLESLGETIRIVGLPGAAPSESAVHAQNVTLDGAPVVTRAQLDGSFDLELPGADDDQVRLRAGDASAWSLLRAQPSEPNNVDPQQCTELWELAEHAKFALDQAIADAASLSCSDDHDCMHYQTQIGNCFYCVHAAVPAMSSDALYDAWKSATDACVVYQEECVTMPGSVHCATPERVVCRDNRCEYDE